MVLSIESDLFYINDITLILDENRIDSFRIKEFRHFILLHRVNDKKTKIYVIRYPGYTMGCIKVDANDIITEIKIYTNQLFITECYPENINIKFKKFIGQKFIILTKDNITSIDTNIIKDLVLKDQKMGVIYNDNNKI